MKKINFIKTLSPKDQQAFLIWYELSVMLVCILLVGMVVCQIVQCYTFARVYFQYRRSVPIHLSQQELYTKAKEYEQKKHLVQKRLESLYLQKESFDSSTILSSCNTLFQGNRVLQSVLVHDAQVTCSLQCAESKDMIALINTLKAHELCKSVVVSHIKTVQASSKSKNVITPLLEATMVLTF